MSSRRLWPRFRPQVPRHASRRAVVPALLTAVWLLTVVAGGTPSAQGGQIVNYGSDWWYSPGDGRRLPGEATFDNPLGRLGVVNASGPVETGSHPFFVAMGENGRACVTCHQPAAGMSLSPATARLRWDLTDGTDPLFAAVDGSNNPGASQSDPASHSLLLRRGLIRVSLPWPPGRADAATGRPEFTIEVVRDPTGVNLDPTYGLHGTAGRVSVFRRPRPVANVKYVMTPDATFNIKLGELADRDPETDLPVGMNMMSDARHPTLKLQAQAAAAEHLERREPLSPEDLGAIERFERQVYMAQAFDRAAMSLTEPDGPQGLGPRAMERGTTHVLGNKLYDPVFLFFDMWLGGDEAGDVASARASVARGNDIFMQRQFWIRDVTHMNSIGLGNPIKRTCVSCHNAQMTGQDLAPGWMDIGTNNFPTWTEPSTWSATAELPVFKVTCDASAPPHPYLGRLIYTTDPGRALITGRCADVGSIVMQQLRGLAARAPYFANGSAATLREVVDYYDRRFDMKLTEQEQRDLANFLGAL